MDREAAIAVVDDHVKSDSLKKHLLAVEQCMRAYAREYGEDEEAWGVAGLVHDFDWEVCPTPESHPTFGVDILRSRGFDEETVRAVLSHGNHTGIARESLMEKALFACDELSGLVTAVALVRPSKSLEDTAVRSVKPQDEGQGVRQIDQPGRHRPGSGRAGRGFGRPHRVHHRGAEAGRR